MIIFIISKLINCWNRITILHFIILDLSAFPHFVECKIFYAYLLGRINQKFAVVRLQIEYFIVPECIAFISIIFFYEEKM